MQRYHRVRHRWLWLLMSLVVVLLFIEAWLSRPPQPRMERLPELLQGEKQSRRD